MLKVFYGTDIFTTKQKAYLAATAGCDEGQEIITIESEGYLPGTLLGLSSTSSLFGGAEVYLIDATDKDTDLLNELLSEGESLASSQNLFVCVCGSLLAAEKKQVVKHAAVLEEYKKDAAVKFNPFQLADALARKDKKMFWLLLEEAKRNQLSSEEIIGTLWWQLKTMRLASLTKNAAEAGLKDFPYQKAKRALSHFKDGEVEEKARELLKIYHQGHRGEVELDLALEEWVLGV